MKLNKIFICTLLIILSSSLVLAICPEDPGCELNLIEMDSADIALLSQDQLANVPPEKLDFSKLSIDQISQLSSGQKISVSVDQIKDHLDKLGDLGDYFAAPEAIQEKYGVGIDNFGSGAIISEGVLKATSGEKEQFDFSNKQNWKVSINPDGIVTILEPKEISQGSISEKDVFTLFEETVFVSNEGSSQKVKGLSFNDGKIFVKKGDTAEIGTYHISSDKNDVIIFFDPKVSPDGNSVLISDKKIAISTIKTGTVKVQPQLGNKLFNMLMRKYEHDRNNDPIPGKFSLVPDDLDSLEISVSNGDSLEVESREDIVKTPLLKHKDGGGSTIIDTGKMKISINKGKLKVTPPEPIYGFDGLIVIKNSVAFELVSDSFKETLRTSSSNRFILLNNGKEIAGNNLGLRVSDQIEFNLLKGIDDLKISNPKLKFTVSKGMGDRVSPNIIQLLEEWLEDKPEIEKYLDVISITLKRGATADVILDRYDSISLPGKNKRGPKFVALISIGERSSDPATVDDKNVRDIKNQLGTLDH